MKSAATSKKLPADFPRTSAEIEAIIAAAPGEDRPLTQEEEFNWENAVVVHGGGIEAVRKALAEARRKRGQRGPQKAPTKDRISLRLPADVLARWKATGPGWQTRMAERLSK